MNSSLKLGLAAVVIVIAGALFMLTRAPDGQDTSGDELAAVEETAPVEETVEAEVPTSVIEEAPVMTETETDDPSDLDTENTLLLTVSTGGPVVIELYPDKAPNHVARFKELASQGFYDDIVFHRVIEGFMAQTGDPTGTGTGGSGQNIKAEFNDISHVRGVVSTARSGHPDSADSQFFIMLGDAPHLDGQYTAWGRVVEGMEYIDQIKKGASGSGTVEDPRDFIVSFKVGTGERDD